MSYDDRELMKIFDEDSHDIDDYLSNQELSREIDALFPNYDQCYRCSSEEEDIELLEAYQRYKLAIAENDRATLESVKQGLEDAKEGRVQSKGSFSDDE